MIDKKKLKPQIDEALDELRQECLEKKQHDDMSPLQELSAILPIALKHAYSLRLIAKEVNMKEKLIIELASFIKDEAMSDNGLLTEDDLEQVFRILFKAL